VDHLFVLKSWVTGMDAEPWIPIDFWFSDEQWLKIFPAFADQIKRHRHVVMRRARVD
jgi:hypothetical protein